MGKFSRDKGARGERELFGLLSDELGTVVKRGLVATREGGADTLDVPGWAIECKRVEGWSTHWWQQTVEQAESEGRRPVLFHRESRRPWYAYVDPHDMAEHAFPNPDMTEPVRMSLSAWCQLAREGLRHEPECRDIPETWRRLV